MPKSACSQKSPLGKVWDQALGLDPKVQGNLWKKFLSFTAVSMGNQIPLNAPEVHPLNLLTWRCLLIHILCIYHNITRSTLHPRHDLKQMIIAGSKNKYYCHAQKSCLLCQALHIINLWCVICPKDFIMSPLQLPLSATPQLKIGFFDRFTMHKAWPKPRPAIYYRDCTQTSPIIRKWCFIGHKV